MAIHEECGVFGVIQPEPANVGRVVYYGLYALQHRGQESCGIVVNDDGVFASHKDLGLVGEVFGRDVLERFPQGTMAVGHTRYGTTGASNRRNCQPIEVNHQKGRMALAHNGNLSNAAQLRSKLELTGAIFHTTSDTETIAYIVTRERLTSPSIEDALSAAMKHLEGAYSLVLMSPQKLICVRDPHGFRPLCYGKLPGGGYAAASESCALTAVGAEFVRDLEPGEILIFQGDTVSSRREHCGKCPPAHCVFEHIYFARPDSVIDGASVELARQVVCEFLDGGLEERYEIEFSADQESEPVTIPGDEALLKRALGNLIQNSIVHNPQGCRSSVSVLCGGTSIMVEVVDDGAGVSSEKLEELTAGGHRLESTDEKLNLRHGLGVLLVWQIMEAHKGTVTMESEPQKGFKTALAFPVSNF